MIVGVVASLAVFTAVSSLLLWMAGVKSIPGEARLRELAPSPRPFADAEPFSERVVFPMLDGLTRFVIQLLPHAFVARVGRQLVTAGRPMTTQAFFTLVMVTGVMLPLSVLGLLWVMNDGRVTTSALLLALAAAVLGATLPFAWLRRRVRARKLAVWKSLADAFDLVTVSVEAGLGLDAALRHVSEKLRGPLSEEISQALREVGMGRPRREALQEMAERVDVAALVTFVNAVVQAEQLGTSLGRVLRAQALTLRVHRRQRAEEISRKAPVKMVFPLVLCIMPSFFVITVGPIFVRLVSYLSD